MNNVTTKSAQMNKNSSVGVLFLSNSVIVTLARDISLNMNEAFSYLFKDSFRE